jgi:uncharacterized protein
MEGVTLSHDPIFYLVAGAAILLVGLAKGGFIGFGALCMPILTLVMDPIKAAGVLLPILIVQDVVGFWAFRKTLDRALLRVMLPGAIIGIFLGWLFAATVSVRGIEALIGIIALSFGGNRLLDIYGFGFTMKRQMPNWVGSIWGMISGFTSQVAHAGGPPFQAWALGRGLPRDTYAGTSILFFAIVNWAKVPAYFALGQFTRENLILTGLFMPLAILSTFAGVALVRHIDPKRFFMLVNVLMVVVGVELLLRAWG